MAASTRPPGAKTGLVTQGCYAAALGDCDGRPTSGEHYISECLLERVPDLVIEGLPWQRERKKLSTRAFRGNVLCERHNNALGSVDRVICDLYDVIMLAHDGEMIGWREFHGEDIERWAMKTLFGLISSGNLKFSEGVENDRPSPPLDHHRVLFSEDELPEVKGLALTNASPRDDEDASKNVVIRPLVYPIDHPMAGRVVGIVVRILGLEFYVPAGAWFPDEHQPRPLGILFRQRTEHAIRVLGCVALRWASSASDVFVSLTTEATRGPGSVR